MPGDSSEDASETHDPRSTLPLAGVVGVAGAAAASSTQSNENRRKQLTFGRVLGEGGCGDHAPSAPAEANDGVRLRERGQNFSANDAARPSPLLLALLIHDDDSELCWLSARRGWGTSTASNGIVDGGVWTDALSSDDPLNDLRGSTIEVVLRSPGLGALVDWLVFGRSMEK